MQAIGAPASAAYLRHRYRGDEGEGRQRKMFERFTERARLVVVAAQEEARRLDHDYVGTEHLLLGLTGAGEGLAVKVLDSLGISSEAIRQRVEESIDRGEQAPSGPIRFTAQAKTVLELSLRESRALSDVSIGTEHILLGLIREGDGVAAHVLLELGADLARTREQVTRLLEERGREHGNQAGGPGPRQPRPGQHRRRPQMARRGAIRRDVRPARYRSDCSSARKLSGGFLSH